VYLTKVSYQTPLVSVSYQSDLSDTFGKCILSKWAIRHIW